MNIRLLKIPMKWVWTIGLLVAAIVGGTTWNRWFPIATSWVDSTVSTFREGSGSGSQDSHAEVDAHAGHNHGANKEQTTLELSAQALRNIGLSDKTIQPIKLETFHKSIIVPALVVERPGRTRVQVSTPMTGVITHVHAVQGEAIKPGALLFQIRLTHEDLVNAQTEFVRTLGELEVEKREITRLNEVTRSGAVAGKLLLERQYASDKLTALLRAQREALRLHGLSDQQINQISSKRRLLSSLQIFAPSHDTHGEEEFKLTQVVRNTNFQQPVQKKVEKAQTGQLILQQLDIHKGQTVNAGETLCILTDYDELFIEGKAFEQDVSQLRQTSEKEWTVDAIFQQADSQIQVLPGLTIAYLANIIDANSRTLHFYVRLPNKITKERREKGNRFIEWKYLPGQRLQLRVPVEEWSDQIVLPVEAIAREGAESFVFQQNGGRFNRTPVHVKYRDQYSVVIANDGSLFPGDVVALRGAHQMQMALKNKAGGGVDPHAGHNH